MPKTSDNLTAKTRTIKKLVDSGVPIDEAYTLAQPDKPVTRQAQHSMRKKLEAIALTEPKRVNKAIKAIESTLQGKPTGSVKNISTSDVLNAAKMVLDRAEPIVNVNQNLNVNVSASPVDLSQYLNK